MIGQIPLSFSETSNSFHVYLTPCFTLKVFPLINQLIRRPIVKSLQTLLTFLLVTTLPICGLWATEQKIWANDPEDHAQYGNQIAMWGDFAVVGAMYDDNENGLNAGAAYVLKYNKSTGDWEQFQKLEAGDGIADDYFGRSVDIYDTLLIVGASNSAAVANAKVYIFHFNGTYWYEKASFSPPQNGEPDKACFGESVTITYGWAMVGQPNYIHTETVGCAHIYKFQNGTWSHSGDPLYSDSQTKYDFMGRTIDMDGNYAVVGADLTDDNGKNSGSAYIFKLGADDLWHYEYELQASDAAESDYFSQKGVAIYDDLVLVATEDDDNENGNDAGAAYLFKRDGSNWTEISKLIAYDGAENEYFGSSVALWGNYALIGSYFDSDGGSQSGSAYAFQDSSGTWVVADKITASDAAESERFGNSVAISDSFGIVGAYFGDHSGFTNAGAVYVYNTVEDLSLNACPQIVNLPDTITMYINDISKLEMEPYASDQNDSYDKLEWTFEESSSEITASYSEATDTLTITSSSVKGIYYLYTTLTDPYGAADKDTIVVDVQEPSAIDGSVTGLPASSALLQNYPNPFNSVTIISFKLPEPEHVEISIFNSAGQKMSTILNKNMSAGFKKIFFNAHELASGIYYYKLVAGHFRQVKKMLVIK